MSTDDDIARGVRALRRACPVMRTLHDQVGNPPLRRQLPGFEGLVRIVIAQQVSAASADAIWHRTARTLGKISPKSIHTASDDDLRACGLSRPKARTLRAAADAARTGALDLDALTNAPDSTVQCALTAIHGIGPWTADIYLMFSLGRRDAWAAGDLALQLAIARAFALSERPTAARALEIAEVWRPWRAVAARLLWAYHARPPDARPAPAGIRQKPENTRSKTP